jgi:hypothetical protein
MKEWLHSFEKNTFDVIIIEGAFMGYFLPVAKVISKHVILRSHNLEHMIWERTQAKQRNLLKRLYFRIQSNRLRKFEERLARMCDSIWSISPVDSFWFKEFNSNCYFIPVAVEEGESVDTLNPNMCFHLGAMDWTPNRMAVDWFLEKIWPKVRKLNPQAQFHLAGNGMPKHYMTNPEKGIFVHGRVPSAEVFAKQHGISIIPLLSGSGVRIKLLENARWGIPIISTRIGAEGVYTTGTKEIVLADFPQDFARKLVELMDDPEAALDMGQLARKDILERFGKRSTINKITKAWPA